MGVYLNGRVPHGGYLMRVSHKRASHRHAPHGCAYHGRAPIFSRAKFQDWGPAILPFRFLMINVFDTTKGAIPVLGLASSSNRGNWEQYHSITSRSQLAPPPRTWATRPELDHAPRSRPLALNSTTRHKLNEGPQSCSPAAGVTSMVQIHPHVAADFKVYLKSTRAGRQRYDRYESGHCRNPDTVSRLTRSLIYRRNPRDLSEAATRHS